MPVTSEQRNRNQKAGGLRLLLLGGIGAALGIIVMIIAEGLPEGIGVAIASLSTVPTLAGLALLVTSLVESRARAGKPFA